MTGDNSNKQEKKSGPSGDKSGPDNSFLIASYEDDKLEAARKFFTQSCDFLKGAVSISDLPSDGRVEVAFAGRSNVGKSSLINALTNRKSLARTSNTPGRTRELNYFTISDKVYLVDMPGYGYARASKSLVQGWTNLIKDYLRGRVQLRRLFLLIDSRHGLKESDVATMELMDEAAVSYQIVLTKVDKLKKGELDKVIDKTLRTLARHPASHPQIILTSSRKGDGVNILRASITELLD